MIRRARIRPRLNRWELLVVILGLGWALVEAYLDPRRFSDLLLHLFMISMLVAVCTVLWFLLWVIIGIVRHRRRERRT